MASRSRRQRRNHTEHTSREMAGQRSHPSLRTRHGHSPALQARETVDPALCRRPAGVPAVDQRERPGVCCAHDRAGPKPDRAARPLGRTTRGVARLGRARPPRRPLRGRVLGRGRGRAGTLGHVRDRPYPPCPSAAPRRTAHPPRLHRRHHRGPAGRSDHRQHRVPAPAGRRRRVDGHLRGGPRVPDLLGHRARTHRRAARPDLGRVKHLWVPGIWSHHATCAYSWISPPSRPTDLHERPLRTLQASLGSTWERPPQRDEGSVTVPTPRRPNPQAIDPIPVSAPYEVATPSSLAALVWSYRTPLGAPPGC